MNKSPETTVIRRISPSLDNARFAVKRAVGETITVRADVFKDGHDEITVMLKWRQVGSKIWRETPMTPHLNDNWSGTLSVTSPGAWEYTIEAWGDVFFSWQHELEKKFAAGLTDLQSEILEGAAFIGSAATRAGKSPDGEVLKKMASTMRGADAAQAHELAHDPTLCALMQIHADRSLSTTSEHFHPIWVDRDRATFAAWYEFFPRSAEGKVDSGSTFRDCLGRIDDAKAMGFDVIYFPPIHPIGSTNRKGRNNSLRCEPGEPGVPYAIGNNRQGVNGGGHKDVAPELGTLEDFDWLVGEIKKRDMEIALDFAINCSPDHPYVKAQVCRESPKKIRGRLSAQFSQSELERTLGRIAGRRSFLVWAWRWDLSGGQPTHQTGRFLGVAHRRGEAAIPRHRFLERGFHQAKHDAGTRQGRLHAELYLFHVAEYETRVDRVFDRTHPRSDEGILPR